MYYICFFSVHTLLNSVYVCSQEVISTETGANDALNQHYITALRKYEVIKDDYDSLRKRYDDLIVSHSAAVNKLELSQVK